MIEKKDSIKLSVIIVAKNEEKKIGDCLKSVEWVDEIIVVDSGSTDKTIEVAQKYNARIIRYNKGCYSDWRNAGLNNAQGEWILYVDADERITSDLKDEIKNTIRDIKSAENFSAYAIPRKNIILGKELKYGGFGKFDYVKRLFRRKDFKKWTGELHEEPNFYHNGKLTIGKTGEVGHLSNKMLHIKATTLSEMVEKTNIWSEVEAKLMYEAKHPPMNIPRFLTAIGREFWFRMIKHKAFLDGTTGLIHGLYQVYSRFISYAKLWEMQLKNESSNL